MDEPVTPVPAADGQRQFSCSQCGANVVFAPGSTSMVCPYCGQHNQIQVSDAPILELDYERYASDLDGLSQTIELLAVHCDTCGAESVLPQNVTADLCPFCGASIVAQANSRKRIKPLSLLPFAIARERGDDLFKGWINSLWFAPGDLRKQARQAGINGVYLPFWTYDSNTTTDYTGERGDDYMATETYTAYENGRSVTRTRQVRKTQWTRVSGQVSNSFDDLLVVATDSLPHKYVQKLEPWDLSNLTPYRAEYLGGFVSQSYDVDLPTGYERAKLMMAPEIERTIRQDIGGDHQRIRSSETQYFDITFKHLLLPIWLSAYHYRVKSYRFMINGRTGEVQGERPYSAIKIVLFILMIVALIATFWSMSQ